MSKLTTILLLLTTLVAGAQTNRQIWQFDKLTNNAAIEANTNAFALVSASNGAPKNVSLGNLRTWVTNGLATSASLDSVSNVIATRITSTSNALASQTAQTAQATNFNSIVVTNSLQIGTGTNAVTFTSAQNGASASDAAFTFGTVNASTGVFGSFRATSISASNLVASGLDANGDIRLGNDVTISNSIRLGTGPGGGTIAASYGQINLDRTLQITAPGGGFIGNGVLLTNLEGGHIKPGTVGTNAMSAAAYAAFIGGGTTDPLTVTNATITTLNAGNLRLKDNSIWNTVTGKEIIVKPNSGGPLQADDAGNNRGDYANDFQRQRTTNTQVAAGSNSVILGGSNNRTANSHSVVVGGQDNYASTYAGVVSGMSNSASVNYAFVGGGFTNAATATHSAVLGGSENIAGGSYSSVIGGRHGKTTKQGEISHASGQFSQRGDAQHSTFVLRGTTSSSETARVLTVNGQTPAGDLSNMLVIPAETVWMFEINLAVQRGVSSAGDTGGGWSLMGVIRRNAAGATTLAQSINQQSWKESGIGTADVAVTADDTNEALKIEVQQGNNTVPMRWVAVVRITQVSWGIP